jgi:hypothetical protein
MTPKATLLRADWRIPDQERNYRYAKSRQDAQAMQKK